MSYRVRVPLTSLVAAVLASSLACASTSAPSSSPSTPPAASAGPEAPTALLFIEGHWESTDPTNRWQMTSTWSPERGRFEGRLAQNGDGSAAAGFTVGELVWTATPEGDQAVRENQMFRAGPGAPAEWQEGAVDVAQSTPERLVTSFSVFQRLP
jgi:hypothetical protein